MPMYDLECGHCGLAGEDYQPMHTQQPTRCPECGHVALRRVTLTAPALHGDDKTFCKGLHDGLPIDPALRNVYLQNAQRMGINPTGRRYMPELANKPAGLDPEAWVPEHEARSYIQRLIRKRGWSCEGRVEVAAPPRKEPAKTGPYRPADDIVERAVTAEIARDKLDLTPSERTQLKTQTAKTLAGVYAEE